MQPMTIPEIVSAVGGTWLNPWAEPAPVTAVCTDSRKIAPNSLFLPITGALLFSMFIPPWVQGIS